MRNVVLQMMTTLNGRLDDPEAWVHAVSDDQYREMDRLYAEYDTILVGRTTYEEMAAYWPGALSSGEGTATNQAMARRMHDYRKLVFSRSGHQPLTEWNNAEQVIAGSDDDLAACIAGLKAQPGGDIHLSGGAHLAQTFIGLGLVDEFRFFVYPVVSPGASWFSRLPDTRGLQLLSTTTFENGVVGLRYAPRLRVENERPERFTELLT